MTLFCFMNNPFHFGRELGSDELVDREEEIASVVQTIRQGGKLFRTFGKGAATMKRSLTRLLNRDILREGEHEGALRYRFEDPFLGAWIERFAAKLQP